MLLNVFSILDNFWAGPVWILHFNMYIHTYIQTCIPNLQCRYYRPGWVEESDNSRMIDTGKLFPLSFLFQRGLRLRPYMTQKILFLTQGINFRNHFRAVFFEMRETRWNWIQNKTEFETLFIYFSLTALRDFLIGKKTSVLHPEVLKWEQNPQFITKSDANCIAVSFVRVFPGNTEHENTKKLIVLP